MTREKKIIAVFSELAEKQVKELQKNPFYEVDYEVFDLKGIRSPIAYIKGAWCLNTLSEKLSDGFKLSDLDGFLGYYENMLFLEFKSAPRYLKPRQFTALIKLVRKTQGTAYVAFGKSCEPTHYFVIDSKNPYGSELFKTSLKEFQEILSDWCEQNKPSEWDEFAFEQDLKAAEETISRIQEEYDSL